MPRLLTLASNLMCPHGGAVLAVSSNSRAKAVGAPILRASDAFTIAGCPFTLPTSPPTPHPCVTVRWVQPAARSRAAGDFTLTEASLGLAVAADQAVQGAILVVATQARVGGM